MTHTSTLGRLKRLSFVALVPVLAVPIGFTTPGPRLDAAASVNMTIADPVPFSVVHRVAAFKAEQVWGAGALGDAIPLADSEGNLAAWMFPYRIGAKKFPAYDEILQEVKKGRTLRDLVRGSRLEEARELHRKLLASEGGASSVAPQHAVPTRGRLGQLDPIRSDGTRSRKLQAAETDEVLKYAEEKAIGAGRFGTIVVSATYNRLPVPVYLYYLPPYFTHLDQAVERARSEIGEGAALRRIYFLGLKGQFFEFVNNGNSVVLHAQTLRPGGTTVRQATQARRAPGRPVNPGAKAQIRQLWAEIERETGSR